ncbi:MAG TPA: hypothetical protein VGC61_01245 [Pyrinomonadaceae bacterium]
MKTPKTIAVTTVVEHKHERLPRFVCIPIDAVSPWKLEATTTVERTINGVEIGRRSLKCWGRPALLVDGLGRPALSPKE